MKRLSALIVLIAAAAAPLLGQARPTDHWVAAWVPPSSRRPLNRLADPDNPVGGAKEDLLRRRLSRLAHPQPLFRPRRDEAQDQGRRRTPGRRRSAVSTTRRCG